MPPDLVERVAIAIAGAYKVAREGASAELVWETVPDDERERFRRAARAAIETYLEGVAETRLV